MFHFHYKNYWNFNVIVIASLITTKIMTDNFNDNSNYNLIPLVIILHSHAVKSTKLLTIFIIHTHGNSSSNAIVIFLHFIILRSPLQKFHSKQYILWHFYFKIRYSLFSFQRICQRSYHCCCYACQHCSLHFQFLALTALKLASTYTNKIIFPSICLCNC